MTEHEYLSRVAAADHFFSKLEVGRGVGASAEAFSNAAALAEKRSPTSLAPDPRTLLADDRELLYSEGWRLALDKLKGEEPDSSLRHGLAKQRFPALARALAASVVQGSLRICATRKS